MAAPKVCVLGAFVADLACRTSRMAKWGETILGNSKAKRLPPKELGLSIAVRWLKRRVQEMLSRADSLWLWQRRSF